MPRKSKISPTPTNDQSPTATVLSVVPVALLIDGENINAPNLIAQILAEAGKMGGVTIRQVYGNWSSPTLQAWKKYLVHYQLKQMGDHVSQSGHNATDITLVIGAMDLLYSGFRHFCLVAGDSDYVPLVRRLREGGCKVWVIGTSSVSTTLKGEADQFSSLEELAQPPPASSPTTNTSMPSANQPPLAGMLAAAYRTAAQRSSSEWVLLAELGLTLRQQFPTFEEVYGKQALSTHLKQYPHLFDVRKQERGNGTVDEVRLRQSP